MPILGAIADDVTGATDLAAMLVNNGARTVQLLGVPPPDAAPPEADAVVVSLKSRTAPVTRAVADSLAALDRLRAWGARAIHFKVCSTFDSTDEGNIGPVADALRAALRADIVPVCPAFPTNGRTVYQGHLFVGSALLNESGMENHPLTPMRDANLVRVLGRQTRARVGLVPFATVERGAEAVRAALASLANDGVAHAILDAVSDTQLLTLGEAIADSPLVVGGSGLALGLPAAWRRRGWLGEGGDAARLPRLAGRAAILAGSCSRATLAQVAQARGSCASFALDPLAHPHPATLAAAAIDWSERQPADATLLIYASSPPERVAAVQAALGRERAGEIVERAFAAIAEALIARGVRRLIVAGGETSGAVVSRLGLTRLVIGPTIDPGVPWTFAPERDLLLALKSGNFGSEDFFTKALAMLEEGA
ncbi:3-oxo-tetronate kinase [Elioraea thermophila]|uniref:3-oxo-tetronate kinase n=1 Tax=Elioraea thermophila TaxID=2185104 RepID=UPI000DF302B2|nr:3-oxo-tetronate kinase [Elioraea thermophila]